MFKIALYYINIKEANCWFVWLPVEVVVAVGVVVVVVGVEVVVGVVGVVGAE